MALTLLVVFAIIILPFLIYYVTSALFFRTANSKAVGKEPPTVPYFVPGIFSAGRFVRHGARKHFAKALKEYRQFAPFKIRAGLHSYVILTDPTQASRVLDAPEHFTTNQGSVEALDKLFGSPEPAKHSQQPSMNLQHDGKLESVTQAYISILSANMHDKMFQYDTWTRIEDLWSFLQLVLARCTLEAIFGSTLLEIYPRAVRDFLDFASATEDFMPGMSRMMLTGISKPRERLHAGFMKYATATSPDINLKNRSVTPTDEGEWNKATGLRVIREHCQSFQLGKTQETGSEVRAAEMLRIIHAIDTGMLSSTFWMITETLRKTHLDRNMSSVIRQHLSPITHKYDILGLSQEPLVNSFQTEISRMRTSSCTSRTNEIDNYPLDKTWSLRKGDKVALFSHVFSLDAKAWKKFQPQSLGRSLEEFSAERFLVSQRRSKSATPSETSEPGFMGTLVTKLTTCDQYPGPHFMTALKLATVSVMLAEFEIQVCDSEHVDAALPSLDILAYGTVKPTDKVAVRIRKRRV